MLAAQSLTAVMKRPKGNAVDHFSETLNVYSLPRQQSQSRCKSPPLCRWSNAINETPATWIGIITTQPKAVCSGSIGSTRRDQAIAAATEECSVSDGTALSKLLPHEPAQSSRLSSASLRCSPAILFGDSLDRLLDYGGYLGDERVLVGTLLSVLRHQSQQLIGVLAYAVQLVCVILIGMFELALQARKS